MWRPPQFKKHPSASRLKRRLELIRLQKDALQLLRTQNGKGQIAGLDVVAQETALAQSELALPPLQKQFTQTRHLLAVLLGNFPSAQPRESFRLADLHLPRDLPVSCPSDLVRQRPDVQAAEANLHSASAQVGVAIANRLPNFTLSRQLWRFDRHLGHAACWRQPLLDLCRKCGAGGVRWRYIAPASKSGRGHVR